MSAHFDLAKDLRARIESLKDLLQEARDRGIECNFNISPDPAGIFKATIAIEKKKTL